MATVTRKTQVLDLDFNTRLSTTSDVARKSDVEDKAIYEIT